MAQLLSLFGGDKKNDSQPEFITKKTVVEEGNVAPGQRFRPQKKKAQVVSDTESSDEGEVSEEPD